MLITAIRSSMPAVRCQGPVQPNFFDCGCFMLAAQPAMACHRVLHPRPDGLPLVISEVQVSTGRGAAYYMLLAVLIVQG
jgi:hypothetical protein